MGSRLMVRTQESWSSQEPAHGRRTAYPYCTVERGRLERVGSGGQTLWSDNCAACSRVSLRGPTLGALRRVLSGAIVRTVCDHSVGALGSEP